MKRMTSLYSLTLVPPSSITAAITGQFSGQRQQEIITASGSRIQLLRVDASTGKVLVTASEDLFAIVRGIAAIRIAGAAKDCVFVSSDAGRVAVLEYKPEQRQFVRIQLESFGRSGIRRVVAGEYVAADPKGRAVMVAAVEKSKIAYVLGRDASSTVPVTLSSPLEAARPRTLVYALTALDVGYDNPVFAALETEYDDAIEERQTTRTLAYYELDLGLNHVVRAWTAAVEDSAHMLFAVPGGADGPSGVLVCAENVLEYRHSRGRSLRVPIPRRRSPLDDSSRAKIIVCGVMHKMKGAFFFLLQSDDGDLFKVTLEYDRGIVDTLSIAYFDTVPLASSLNILRSGFLFVAAESGPHLLYQFEKLGDDEDDSARFSSGDYAKGNITDYQVARFRPRVLENLALVDILDSLSPLISSQVANLAGEDAPQIYALTGQAERSSLRVIRHGLEVAEIVASELPGEPIAVWTTKLTSQDEFDAFIVLSFSNATLVLSIGETVEEVTDSGILSSSPTLAVQQVGDDALVQVYPKGIRHISSSKEVTEWEAPLHTVIVAAATNSRQVAVALSTTEIVYFELDDESQLSEYQHRQQMGAAVTALALAAVPEGQLRSGFLAVGCEDSTVRVLSLDPENTLESLSVQALTAPPSALQILRMPDSSESDTSSALYLHLGLRNGVYLRAVLDNLTGDLSDTQTQFLGPKPVKLFSVDMLGQPTVLALSTRPWLAYMRDVRFMVTPLVYESLEFGSGFSSEQCAEGVVGIEGGNLR